MTFANTNTAIKNQRLGIECMKIVKSRTTGEAFTVLEISQKIKLDWARVLIIDFLLSCLLLLVVKY